MSAEVLRRAAALMRERAEAAPTGSPWTVASSRSSHRVTDNLRPGVAMAVADVFPTGGSEHQRHMAEHIASWHPAVALAVADWLEWVADNGIPDPHEVPEDCFDCEYERQALAVARAYLGDVDV